MTEDTIDGRKENITNAEKTGFGDLDEQPVKEAKVL